MRTSNLTLIALSVLASQGVLSAEHTPPEDVRTVSYAGLDLNSEAGARVAYRRIRTAAKGVCSSLYTLVPGQQRYIWETCVNDATVRAVADIGAPALTAYAGARMGGSIKPRPVTARQ